MPVTKFEKFVFTLLMASFMVCGMALYNSMLRLGLGVDTVLSALPKAAMEYLFAVPVAYFFGSRCAMYLAKHAVPRGCPAMFPFVLSFFTVIVMVPPMSFIVAAMNAGTLPEMETVLSAIARNYAFAMPLQIAVIGPLVRTIFTHVRQTTTGVNESVFHNS